MFLGFSPELVPPTLWYIEETKSHFSLKKSTFLGGYYLVNSQPSAYTHSVSKDRIGAGSAGKRQGEAGFQAKARKWKGKVGLEWRN